MESTLDYARFGRQIALPELGAAGQRALAETAVAFESDDDEVLAAACAHHARAGGTTAMKAAITVVLPASGGDARVALATAAWGAVEAARRLSGEPAREFPTELRDRLAGTATQR